MLLGNGLKRGQKIAENNYVALRNASKRTKRKVVEDRIELAEIWKTTMEQESCYTQWQRAIERLTKRRVIY